MISFKEFLLRKFCASLYLFFYSLIMVTAICGQTKTIAVTIDDLPLNGPRIPLVDLQRMTKQLLETFRKNNVPVVGFVNESLLFLDGETDQRIALLRSWSDSGVELGNHTFSHLGFRDNSLQKYEDDFIRGDAVTRRIQKEKHTRFFRHPFLQMGPTPEAEAAFEKFIGERGYRIAPVTVSTMDWMFLAAYRNAIEKGDGSAIKKVSEDYLRFVEASIESREKASENLFGRQISHILLLHANELNGENLDRLFAMLKSRGYQFVTLETALKDPLYVFPEKYTPTSDWIQHWAFSKGKKIDSPQPPDYVRKAYDQAQIKK